VFSVLEQPTDEYSLIRFDKDLTDYCDMMPYKLVAI